MKQPSLRNGLAAWDSTSLRSYTHPSLIDELINLLATRTAHLQQAAHSSGLNNEIKFFPYQILDNSPFLFKYKGTQSRNYRQWTDLAHLGLGACSIK